MSYIRPAVMSDREDCLAIARMYPQTRSFSAPWFSGAEIFDKEEDIYVVDEGGVGGFYSARFRSKDHFVVLEYIAVAVPNYGTGSELLKHLQRRVRLSGTHQAISTMVSEKSLNFWKKNAFDVERVLGSLMLPRRAVWAL